MIQSWLQENLFPYVDVAEMKRAREDERGSGKGRKKVVGKLASSTGAGKKNRASSGVSSKGQQARRPLSELPASAASTGSMGTSGSGPWSSMHVHGRERTARTADSQLNSSHVDEPCDDVDDMEEADAIQTDSRTAHLAPASRPASVSARAPAARAGSSRAGTASELQARPASRHIKHAAAPATSPVPAPPQQEQQQEQERQLACASMQGCVEGVEDDDSHDMPPELPPPPPLPPTQFMPAQLRTTQLPTPQPQVVHRPRTQLAALQQPTQYVDPETLPRWPGGRPPVAPAKSTQPAQPAPLPQPSVASQPVPAVHPPQPVRRHQQPPTAPVSQQRQQQQQPPASQKHAPSQPQEVIELLDSSDDDVGPAAAHRHAPANIPVPRQQPQVAENQGPFPPPVRRRPASRQAGHQHQASPAALLEHAGLGRPGGSVAALHPPGPATQLANLMRAAGLASPSQPPQAPVSIEAAAAAAAAGSDDHPDATAAGDGNTADPPTAAAADDDDQDANDDGQDALDAAVSPEPASPSGTAIPETQLGSPYAARASLDDAPRPASQQEAGDEADSDSFHSCRQAASSSIAPGGSGQQLLRAAPPVHACPSQREAAAGDEADSAACTAAAATRTPHGALQNVDLQPVSCAHERAAPMAECTPAPRTRPTPSHMQLTPGEASPLYYSTLPAPDDMQISPAPAALTAGGAEHTRQLYESQGFGTMQEELTQGNTQGVTQASVGLSWSNCCCA